MEYKMKIEVNPTVILREEFDDWAVVFDPDTASGYGLNPIGVIIWKHLDGKHSLKEIADIVRDSCENVPNAVEKDVYELVQDLIDKGLAGFGDEKTG